MRRREQNSTSHPILLFMADEEDHLTGLTGLAPAVTLSKDGGAFASAEGEVSEVGNGWYALAADADDRDTLGTLIIHAEAVGADTFDMDVEILAADPPTQEEIRIEMDTNSKIANLPSDPADQSAISAAITSAHATTDALIGTIAGSGLTSKTYTLTDASTGLPLPGVQVWATTDLAGLNQVDITRTTDDAGQVIFKFNLAAGTTVYIWNRYMAAGTAPDTEVI